MKIRLSVNAHVKANLPDGRYACMCELGSLWRLVIVTVADGAITEREITDTSPQQSGRQGIRHCFQAAVEAEVGTLLLSTSAFAEVHLTLQAFTDEEIQVEAVDRIEFPLDPVSLLDH